MTPLRVRRARAGLAVLVMLATVLWTVVASAAFKPPPINGHVMDTAGLLTPDQVLQIDRKLDAAMKSTGFAVVVFIPKSLEGEDISDVAYTTFRTWGVGTKKGDDGVLLLIAPEEKKTRIETGAGVGGALTDLQSSHINRDVINPLLKQGQYFEAVDKGTDAILHELVTGTPGGTSEPGKDPRLSKTNRNGGGAQAPPPAAQMVKTIAVGIGIVLVIILAIVSPTFRQFLFFFLLFGRGGGGGGGGWGGGGGGGGSGYGGGGGGSGGGGSSDDW